MQQGVTPVRVRITSSQPHRKGQHTMSYIIAFMLLLSSFMPHASEAEYDDFASLAIRIDAVLDQAEEPQGIVDLKSMNYWIDETIPFFVYEGISWFMVYPDVAKFTYYDSGQSHVHLLGTTNCFANEIDMNARFTNPMSPMNTDSGSIATLVHELTHAQGICFDGPRINSEASTQLVTMEVLAAMALRGNEAALYVILDELRYMLVAGSAAFGDNSEIIQKVYGDDPLMVARFEKSLRYWQDTDIDRYYDIVYKYNYIPMYELLANLHKGTIHGVSLPVNSSCYYTSFYPYDSSEEMTPLDEFRCREPLKIDDLQYLIHNLEYLGTALHDNR